MQRFVLLTSQLQNASYEREILVYQKFCTTRFLAILFSGCMKDKISRTYQIRTPIYEVLTKFREGIKSLPAAKIENTGKLAVIGKYIFLSEPYKGIHVIDNSNPARPEKYFLY